MVEPTEAFKPDFSQPPPSLDGLEEAILCARCQRDLTHLPSAARFCPHCGTGVMALSAQETGFIPYAALCPPLATDSHQTVEQLARLRPMAAAVMNDRPGNTPRRPMLLGYASALYRLGWRYESARGANRNLDEALRCYSKASRLHHSAGSDGQSDEKSEGRFLAGIRRAV